MTTAVTPTTITLNNNYISGKWRIEINGQGRSDILEATANTLTTLTDYSGQEVVAIYES